MKSTDNRYGFKKSLWSVVNWGLVLLILAGCAAPVARPTAPAPTGAGTPVTSTQPAGPAETPTSAPIAPPVEPSLSLTLRLDSALPETLRAWVKLPSDIASSPDGGNLTLQPASQGQVEWVYALVAPFPTIPDGVKFTDIQNAWQGKNASLFAGAPLRMAPDTLATLTALWGAPAEGAIFTAAGGSLLDSAWAEQPAWAIVPFEALEPRWKVLRVDGISPLDKHFDPATYALTAHFALQGDPAALAAVQSLPPGEQLSLPATNRDPGKLTVLVMTGVTALVRATGKKMETMGMTYPGKDIRDWLRGADLTHISNEISFTPNCPLANPYQDTLQFCSRPEYIELLEDVGTDIIEMTGNHILDWNQDALDYTFKMYQERGWKYYAAGENLEQARAPIKLEHNGNKIAMLGCNPVGPDHGWATETTPGFATCDNEAMHQIIRDLRAEGYLPIVTYQYFEYYTPDPRPWQEEDFKGMADAGAVIVSGSQAHTPQAMTFEGDSFIHYGLGNLFFDQMDIPVKGTRREFIERHIFYNGKYIGTELLTAMLEEFARPRPMTADERTTLLTDIFTASGWIEPEKRSTSTP